MEGFPAAKLQRDSGFDGKWCNGNHYNGKITAAFSTQSKIKIQDATVSGKFDIA